MSFFGESSCYESGHSRTAFKGHLRTTFKGHEMQVSAGGEFRTNPTPLLGWREDEGILGIIFFLIFFIMFALFWHLTAAGARMEGF